MLEKINQIFGDIKDAIQEKGVDIGDCESPETYADRIKMIKIASDSDCEGECCDGTTGYVYYLFPVFKASATAPNTPSESANAIVLADDDNYISRLTYPNGWESVNSVLTTGANNIHNSVTPKPMWMSYCIFAIKQGTVTMFRTWTPPMCLGYPYTNPTTNLPYDNPNGGNSDNNKYYASKTFVVFTEMASSNVVPSRPTGGFWNIDTNQLTGNVVSTTSAGNIIWHTNYYRVSGTYTYVSIGTFDYNGNLIGTWSDPFCIASLDGKNGSNGKDGRDGRDGADGVNIEFIYKRCANLSAFRELTTPESEIYITNHVPTGWTAQPTGIDCTDFKVEACCTRKLTNNGVWGEWQGPVIWAICGGSGSGSGEGGGEEGGSGQDGRSITSVDYWFKVSASESDIVAPPLTVEDPTIEGWSKQAGAVSAQYPYLWCFVQTNFSTNLTTECPYSRSDAYIVRKFNTDTSGEFSALEQLIESNRQTLQDQIDNFDKDFSDLDKDVDDIRSQIEDDINTQLDSLNESASMAATKLELANAVGTLNDKITAQVTSAAIKVNPGLITAMAAVGQTFWYKEGTYYPYDHHLSEFINDHSSEYESDSSTLLSDYDTYMKKAQSAGGPSDGPFERKTVVSRFSSIEEDADSIKTKVSKFKKIWKKGNEYRDYDYFEDTYSGADSGYESYVIGLGYELMYTSDELSGILQTVDEIQMQVGNMHYYWRKLNGDVYQYAKYEQPSNMTRDDYESSMTTAGWVRMDWSDNLSTFDITEDSITSAVKKASLSWVKYDSNNNIIDIKSYDYWIAEYEQASSSLDYDNWVAQNKQYQKKEVKDSWSTIKQTADRITSMVSDIDGNTSSIEQLSDRITLATEGDSKYWNIKNSITYNNKTLYGPYPYRQWWDDYVVDIGDNDEPTTEGYETWVPGTVGEENPNYVELKTDGYSLGAFSLENDQILMGLSGHNGEYYGAITLQKEPGTNNAKIILDANNTQVNGDLLVGAINKANTLISGNNIDTGTLKAGKVESISKDGRLKVKIENGLAEFYLDQTKRIDIGIEGTSGSNQSLVLKFFDANGTALYNLGPAGFIDMNGQFIYEFDHNLD